LNDNRNIKYIPRYQLNGNVFLFKIEEFTNNGKKNFPDQISRRYNNENSEQSINACPKIL